MFPEIVFCIFFPLNALIRGEKSSGAVPLGLGLLWSFYGLDFLYPWFLLAVTLATTNLQLKIQ